jgi:glycosyltransferase involved in cell wall biosynthesis
VDTQRFRFSPSARTRVRHKLGMEESFVGIYVGKFGGVYYAAEAFQVFAAFAGRMPAFRMVVLSPMPASDVRRLARTAGFPEDRLVVTAVSHAEVPDYLSAADVGFATYRIAPAHRFLSPVKVGEYWASGLPTVITEGTGDDSAIVEAHDAGAVVSLTPNSEAAAVTQIVNIVGDPDHRDRIASLAARFRSRERIRDAYHDLGFL